MSELDLAAARDAAMQVATLADAVSLRHFSRGVAVTTKPDGSPVTAADREVETLVRDALRECFPDHAQLGEEHGGAIDPHTPTWVVDPIDATKNFMRGVPVWATLIALVVEGAPVVGVVSAPAMGERWDAARGLGARRNGEPVHVSGIAELGDAHVLHGGLDWFRHDPGNWERLGELVDRAWRARGFGDFWMHVLVASGQAEVAFERDVSVWDVAAPACVVTEAGGRVTAWDGGDPLTSGDVVSSNGLVHDTVRALLCD